MGNDGLKFNDTWWYLMRIFLLFDIEDDVEKFFDLEVDEFGFDQLLLKLEQVLLLRLKAGEYHVEEFVDDLLVPFGQYHQQICFLILSRHFNFGLNLFRNDAFKFVFQTMVVPLHVDEAKRRFLNLSYELIKLG